MRSAELAALMPRPKSRPVSAAGVAAAVILLVAAGWKSLAVSWDPGGRPAHALGLTPSARPVIAVLPFQNLSERPDSDYFVEGVEGE